MCEEEKEKKRKSPAEEAEEVKMIFQTLSKEVPALVKGVLDSVFSEEAGKSIGKAAAAFYKELKESGMPDEVAVRMTEKYIGVFTSLGDLLGKMGKGKKFNLQSSSEIGKEIEEKIKEKLAEKGIQVEEDED